jgi:sugar/nucleoside kinase (ribokinase family)
MKKKPKIITIGGATFDIFVRPHDQSVIRQTTATTREELLCLKYGGKVKVDEVHETFGGGATNTAVGFSRMGFDASCVTMVGDPYGDRVIKNLEVNNVNTKFVQHTPKDKTSFSVIINIFDGDRTVLGYPGANDFFTVKALPLKELEKTDWIFLNHLTKLDHKIPSELIKILKKNPKIKLAWNPGYEQLKMGLKAWKELLKHTEVLLINKEEAALFSGVPFKLAGNKQADPSLHVNLRKGFLPPYADDVSDIMLEIAKYGVKTVVITDGRNGAQASDGQKLYFCPVVSTKRVDTLGAGDAFGSGFVSALILGKDLKAALLYGTLNANSVVSYFGAQTGLMNRKALENKLHSTDLCVTMTSFIS